MNPITVSRPDHSQDPSAILETLREILQFGPTEEGEYATTLERKIAEKMGMIYAVCVNSYKTALSGILSELGYRQDSEILCSTYTSISTIHAILSAGATPVFVDVASHSYNLSISDAEKKLTKASKALVLTHSFGIPAKGPLVQSFCQDNGLTLIEDVEGGFGSAYNSHPLGTFGQVALVNYHPKSVLGLGEGCTVITDEHRMAHAVRTAGKKMTRETPLTSMSEFQGALGLWSMDHIEEAVLRRKAAFDRYQNEIVKISSIEMMREPARGVWNHSSFPIRVDPNRRELVLDYLRKNSIEATSGSLPTHLNSYVQARLHPPRLREAEEAAARTVMLPMYSAISSDEQEVVLENLRNAV